MGGDAAIIDYNIFCEVYEVVRKVHVSDHDGARPADLAKVEAEVAKALPGFSLAESGLAAQRLVTLADIFHAMYGDQDKRELGREVNDYLKYIQQSAQQEEIEDFLPEATYLEFRKLLLELLYQNVLYAETSKPAQAIRKRLLAGDLEIAQVRNQLDLWASIQALFDAQIDVADKHAFRKVDRDRTGKVCAQELLRAFHPDVPSARIKQAMKVHDEAWRPLRNELIKKYTDDYETEMSGDWAEEEEEGEDCPLLVVDEETFTYCKDVFECIDLDRSGEISSRELAMYLEENESPFWKTPDWKELDRNRDGYCSFLEFLRCFYTDAPAWKVKKDLETLRTVYGLEYRVARKKSLRKAPTSAGGSPLLKIRGMTEICAQRGGMFDTRIQELERKFQEADRESKRYEKERQERRFLEESKRLAKEKEHVAKQQQGRPVTSSPDSFAALQSRHPEMKYKVLSHDEQQNLNQKIYYHQVDRLEAREQNRQSEFQKASTKESRWVNRNKLAFEDLDELNDRLYTAPIATIAEKRAALLETSLVDLVPPRAINEDDLAASVTRLYTSDLQVRKENLQMLESKYSPTKRNRVMSPQATTATGERLYTKGRERKAAKEEALFKRYIGDRQLPHIKLDKQQQATMIERLCVTKS